VFDFEDVESHDSNLEGRLGLMRIKLYIVIRRAKKVIIYISCGLSRETDRLKRDSIKS
jgi:hypothetical protein